MTMDLEGARPKHPNSDICIWKYRPKINFWSGDCGIKVSKGFLTKIMGAMQFSYCPKCGKKMVKEITR